jgi:hypothetical protein
MKLYLRAVEWGGPDDDWYYVCWWNWLPKSVRYLGYQGIYYDGPHGSFGFWWFNVSWSTPWTRS